MYFRARTYWPGLGRFGQRDPVANRRPLHHYASDPRLQDPFGRAPGDWYDPRSYDWGTVIGGVASDVGETGEDVLNGVAEVGTWFEDIPLAGGVWVNNLIGDDAYIYIDDVQFRGYLANALKAGAMRGEGFWKNSVRQGAVAATAWPTGGGSVVLNNIYNVFDWRLKPSQASDYLWRGARSQTAGAAAAWGGAKVALVRGSRGGTTKAPATSPGNALPSPSEPTMLLLDQAVSDFAPGVADDAFVNFGKTTRGVVAPPTGKSYWFRFGDIKHLTPQQIEATIGALASAGEQGGAVVMRVAGKALFTKVPNARNFLSVDEYTADAPVEVERSITVQPTVSK